MTVRIWRFITSADKRKCECVERDMEIPFAPFPGLEIRVSDKTDDRIKLVQFDARTGIVECQLETSEVDDDAGFAAELDADFEDGFQICK